jgi:hypothetical protein
MTSPDLKYFLRGSISKYSHIRGRVSRGENRRSTILYLHFKEMALQSLRKHFWVVDLDIKE